MTSAGGRRLDLPRDVVDATDQPLVLERDHVPVKPDEDVDRALAGLRLRPDAVDEEIGSADRGENRVDVSVEPLQHVLPDALLLGDRPELTEEGRHVAGGGRGGRRAACGQQPARREQPARHGGAAEQGTTVDRLLPATGQFVGVAHVDVLPSFRVSVCLPCVAAAASVHPSSFRLRVRPKELEHEPGRPRELRPTVPLPGDGAVVLPQAAPIGELEHGAPNLARELGVAVPIQSALQDPVQDRPDRPAPVPRRLEPRVARGLARHREVLSHRGPRIGQPFHHPLRARRVGDAGVERREPGRAPSGYEPVGPHVEVGVGCALLVPQCLVQRSRRLRCPLAIPRRGRADDRRDLGEVEIGLHEESVEEHGLQREWRRLADRG